MRMSRIFSRAFPPRAYLSSLRICTELTRFLRCSNISSYAAFGPIGGLLTLMLVGRVAISVVQSASVVHQKIALESHSLNLVNITI